MRFYSQNENIFFYGNEIKIKIEIPNSFLDYYQLFPFFSFFEQIIIKHNNLPKLLISNNVKSSIQIVCNYLKSLSQINDKDIYIEGISFEKSRNRIEAIPLSQEKCQSLIFQYLNIQKPNFYQIESYIKIIAQQLELFSKSYYLNVSHLSEIQKYKKNLQNIRFFFINSLIHVTKHFITSAYENILKGQNIAYEQQKGKIDSEKANEKANEILMQKEPFSLEKIKPSLIIINEDNQSISEIVT